MSRYLLCLVLLLGHVQGAVGQQQTAYSDPMDRVRVLGAVDFEYSFNYTLKVSEALERVGGITEQAYPLGAVLLRYRSGGVNACQSELLAKKLTQQILASSSMNNPDAAMVLAAVNSKRYVRLPVIADPYRLRVSPEMDILLTPGDILYVPVRPSSVAVMGKTGEVKNVKYQAGKSALAYVKEAQIDLRWWDRQALTVLPNGDALRVYPGLFREATDVVPPGSLILLDAKPYDSCHS